MSYADEEMNRLFCCIAGMVLVKKISTIRSSLYFTMSTPPFQQLLSLSLSLSLFTLGRSYPRELSAKQPLVHAITSQIKRQKKTHVREMNAEAQGHTSVPLMPKSRILFPVSFFLLFLHTISSNIALH